MRPIVREHKITKLELENMQMPKNLGVCIIHIPYRNLNDRTEAGLYIVGDEDYKPHFHAERWGYVYKKPRNLLFDRTTMESMSWKTDIEIEVGDKVWFDYNKAINAHTFVCDGEMYKVMDYEFLYVVKREEKIIPLNGYVLFSEIMKENKSSLLVDEVTRKGFFQAAYVGSANKEYMYGLYSDKVDLKAGDVVMMEKGTTCFALESSEHMEFSKFPYYLQQRKNIVAILTDNMKEIAELHDDVIGVSIVKRDLGKGIITLLKDKYPYRLGLVKESNCKDIPIGSYVVAPNKEGVTLNGLEYFTQDRIVYYE